MDVSLITRSSRFFVAWYLADLIASVSSVTATLLLAERFAGIGAWRKEHVLFMLGYAMAVSGISATFFSYNVSHISRRLGRGQLDHTLIQPLPLWMALLTEGFMPISGTAVLLPGIGLMAWGMLVGRHHGVPLPDVTPGWLALLALQLLASLVIQLSFSYFWGSLAFWAPRGAEEISSSAHRAVDSLKPFPLDGVAPLLQAGLLSALPVGWIAWYPCRALLGLDRATGAVLATPAAALLLAALAALAFRRGLREYARTGSQRYSGWGHRS
jgi:ABC-2 type transport system permease protein